MTSKDQGQFCWLELTAINWKVAKAFYCDLFNWRAEDEDIGDGMFYTKMYIENNVVAAMFQRTPEQEAQGVMTNWLTYIAVDDVDATLAIAEPLNANVLAGPHNVMDAGRMAIMQEPNGAVFAIWQANQHAGIGQRDIPGSLCWSELATLNREDSKSFYHQILGWQYDDKDMMGMIYTELAVGEHQEGGMLEMGDEWGDTPPHWMNYFAVDNCDEAVDKAQSLGAVICVPVTNIPDVGRFAVINDPQGATFSIIEINQQQ